MQCQTPYPVVMKSTSSEAEHTIGVPCGQCPDCIKRRVSQWSFRLQVEEKTCVSAKFLTLTYDPEHVPYSSLGLMTLRKEDCQLFLKRLRHKVSEKVIYYMCGEYGSRFLRPHYHAIMFNADVQAIESAWQLGEVHYGDVTAGSIAYCMKYMNKRSKPVGYAENDDRSPEFAIMSKGIGKMYMTPERMQWHLKDLENRSCVSIGKFKVAMPRYYKDKLYSDHYFPSVEDAKRVKNIVQEGQLTKMNNAIERQRCKDKDYDNRKIQSDLQKWREMDIKGEDKNIF